MAATFGYAVWFLCVCSLGNVFPVDCAHFMGGIIRWGPAAFDGTVQITHRIAWRRDAGEGGTCTQATIDAQTLFTYGGRLTCQSGCNGTIGNFSYYCTEFSVTDNWSAGERTYMYNITGSSFEAVFASGDWISLVTGRSQLWEFRVRGNLTYRQDTGSVNSPPVVNIPPLIRLQRGCSHTIKIPVEDADGDPIRCRWAESSLNECGGVCRSFPANLNGRDCEIQYTGSNISTGDYAVALQVEDFICSTATTPLSSVPVQFVVHVRVRSFPSSSCSSKPELVGDTPLNGSYFEVPFNTSWNTTIIARVAGGSSATSITEFVTASPLGMRKSNLRQYENPREWQMDVMWTPAESQFGPNIFCFAAMDNTGLQSTQRCIVLLVACKPPTIVPGSMSPIGEIFSNQSYWSMSIEFDKQFTRPTRDSFIRIFGQEEDEMFLSINAKTSSAVTYPGPSDTFGRTLTFKINSCQLPSNQTFYVLFDAGVAVGTDLIFCHTESPPLTDPTLWTIMFRDTQGQSNTVTGTNENILITTVCTVLAFIVGVISGLVTYHCVSALLKRKANLERQRQSGNLKRIHYKKNVNIRAEASDVYDKVIPRASRPGMSDVQLKLSDNVAYGQV